MRLSSIGIIAASALFAFQPLDSQPVPPPASLSYADFADLAIAAPVVAEVEIRRASRLSPREAPNVAPGLTRFLIQGEVSALIRGANGLTRDVSWLIDLPNDSRGRPVRIARRSHVLIFAETVPGRPGELRLIAPDAQLPASPESSAAVRGILTAALAPDAPPRLTGIGRAFRVPGVLAGESETQFFLQTADNRPISLIVLRRPGETPRWSVALREFVDNAAPPPAPGTLLWYRLACFLPRQLPRAVTEGGDAGDPGAIAADYRVVLDGLGPCPRNRTVR